MQKDLNYYISKFRNLRVNTAGGKTPYQPILLLSIIELIGQRYISENRIYLTTTLMSVFVKYRSQLSPPNYQADLAQPFFFLSRADEPFWYLCPKPAHEEILRSGSRLNTVNLLMKNVDYAYVGHELFSLLQSPINRNALIAVIATRWFSDKTSQIQKLFGISPLQTTYSKLENNRAVSLAAEQNNDELYDLNRKDIEEIVRDATFRKSIIALYDYKCAFCKLRIVSIKDENIVDGSHIKPFAKFKDDSYTNGISLCKNHHWAFDHGWFGIGDGYEIIIPHNRFDEEPPEDSKRMMDYHQKPIALPNQEDFYPRSEALQWHRNFWKIA